MIFRKLLLSSAVALSLPVMANDINVVVDGEWHYKASGFDFQNGTLSIQRAKLSSGTDDDESTTTDDDESTTTDDDESTTTDDDESTTTDDDDESLVAGNCPSKPEGLKIKSFPHNKGLMELEFQRGEPHAVKVTPDQFKSGVMQYDIKIGTTDTEKKVTFSPCAGDFDTEAMNRNCFDYGKIGILKITTDSNNKNACLIKDTTKPMYINFRSESRRLPGVDLCFKKKTCGIRLLY